MMIVMHKDIFKYIWGTLTPILRINAIIWKWCLCAHGQWAATLAMSRE